MKRHYNFYVDICNIYDRDMPNFLTSTEPMFLILRNNLAGLFPNLDDDHVSTTSFRS